MPEPTAEDDTWHVGMHADSDSTSFFHPGTLDSCSEPTCRLDEEQQP